MMPSPEKTVRKSVAVCRRTGMNRREALTVVINVCNAVLRSYGYQTPAMGEWITQVSDVARAELNKPSTERLNDWR